MTGISFLTDPLAEGRSRLRIGPVLAPLRELGLAVRLVPFPKGWLARRTALRSLKGQTVVLPARLYGGLTLKRLRSQAKTLILDLDDAIMERPSDSPKEGPSRTRAGRYRRCLAVVDGVSCGGPALAKRLHRDFAGPVTVVPNPVFIHPPRARSSRAGLQALWIGSPASSVFLEALREPLVAARRRGAAIRLRLVGASKEALAGLPEVERRAWSEAEARRSLTESDLVVMPLADDPWCRGKSGYKVAEAMGAGLPVISVPQGNGDYLLPKGYPWLAGCGAEWAAALWEAHEDRERRQELGDQLQDEAQRRFTPAIVAQAWLRALAPERQSPNQSSSVPR